MTLHYVSAIIKKIVNDFISIFLFLLHNNKIIRCINGGSQVLRKDNKEKLEEYQKRYRFWTDKRISQFTFQNNIFLVVGLGIMGYCWKERASIYTELIIDPYLKIDFKTTIFIISMVILLISILTGLLLAVSRLYDIRLTTNILLTRKRALKKNIDIKDESVSTESLYQCVLSFYDVFCKYQHLEIVYNDIQNKTEELQKKFTKARQISKNLGDLSWKLMKYQTISLLVSICLIFIVILVK